MKFKMEIESAVNEPPKTLEDVLEGIACVDPDGFITWWSTQGVMYLQPGRCPRVRSGAPRVHKIVKVLGPIKITWEDD